jgi:hypothetical protein
LCSTVSWLLFGWSCLFSHIWYPWHFPVTSGNIWGSREYHTYCYLFIYFAKVHLALDVYNLWL